MYCSSMRIKINYVDSWEYFKWEIDLTRHCINHNQQSWQIKLWQQIVYYIDVIRFQDLNSWALQIELVNKKPFT